MPGVVPVEIIEDILSRLPTKSLLRFSLVSKQWFNLISDPIFIQSHLKHVLSDQYDCQQQQKLLITSYLSSEFYSVDYESVDCNQRQLKNLPFSAPNGVTVLGSCNGLFCIAIQDEDGSFNAIIIWNPLFKNYKSVPYFKSLGLEAGPLGFGYDSLTDDYNLVKFDYRHLKVDVYSTKTNTWRSILPESDLYKIAWVDYDDVGTFFNGSIYLLVVMENEIYKKLLQFDLKNEKFRFVKPPPLISFNMGNKLTVLKGYLGIFSWKDDFEDGGILVMKEDNCNVITWGVICTEYPAIGEPICLKTNDEIIFRVMMELVGEKDGPVHEAVATSNSGIPRDGLIIYNPHDGGIVKKGPIEVAVDSVDYTIYVETLVSVS